MDIPVRNVFYLLSYAWGTFEAAETLELSALDAETPAELTAHLLVQATRRLLRRGLDRGYRTTERELAGIRGQIDFNESLSRMLLSEGRSVCHVDELTHDVLHNQLLKSSLESLAGVPDLDDGLRRDARRLAGRMRDVTSIELRPKHFRRVQIDRNARFYRFVMDLCRLVADNTFIDESTGTTRFRDFLRDEAQMHDVFETFLRNFYGREHSADVGREHIEWHARPADEASAERLPRMETDLTLREGERILVIDAKYMTGGPLQSGYRSGTERIRSKHLYQLFAYVENYAVRESDRTIEGMLLYPAIDQSLDLAYDVHGHRMRVCTVDLNRDWRAIRERLLDLVSSDK